MHDAPKTYADLPPQLEKQLDIVAWKWPRSDLDAALDATLARVAAIAIQRALHQHTVVHVDEAGVHVDIRHTHCRLVVKWQHLLRLEGLDSELGLGSEGRYLSVADKLEKLAKQCRKQAKVVAKIVRRREREEAGIWQSATTKAQRKRKRAKRETADAKA